MTSDQLNIEGGYNGEKVGDKEQHPMSQVLMEPKDKNKQ